MPNRFVSTIVKHPVFFRKYGFVWSTKMTEQEHTSIAQRSITSENGHEMVAPWFVEAPLKRIAQNMRKTYSLVWSKLKTCMDIGLSLWGSKSMHFVMVAVRTCTAVACGSIDCCSCPEPSCLSVERLSFIEARVITALWPKCSCCLVFSFNYVPCVVWPGCFCRTTTVITIFLFLVCWNSVL